MSLNLDQFIQNLKKMNHGKVRVGYEVIFEVFSKSDPINYSSTKRYEILYDYLITLNKRGYIKFPSKKNWTSNTRPSLPNWVSIIESGNRIDKKSVKKINWHPKLTVFNSVTKLSQETIDDLITLNDYYINNDINQLPFIAIKERSYLIFKEEKRLDELRTYPWFNNRITLNELRCYRTQEPFASKSFFNAKTDYLIIIENKDTFDSLIRANSDLKQPYYQTVVYGNGNQISDTIKWIKTFNKHVSCVKYFGDIDKEGFRIAERVKQYIESIKLDFALEGEFYSYCVKKYDQLQNIYSPGEIIEIEQLLNLNQNLKLKIHEISLESKSIKQEILSTNDFVQILKEL